jgi:DNA polymerase-3 subunit chi
MTSLSSQLGKTDITFYVLPSQSQQERLEFACKLIEKIYRSGQNCFVLTESSEQSATIDKLLWTFRAGSFVPHQIYTGILPQLPQTILIGFNDIPESRQNVIINLSASIPDINPSTERILEILDNSEVCKQAGRQRYRQYTHLEFTITTHNMSK